MTWVNEYDWAEYVEKYEKEIEKLMNSIKYYKGEIKTWKLVGVRLDMEQLEKRKKELEETP